MTDSKQYTALIQWTDLAILYTTYMYYRGPWLVQPLNFLLKPSRKSASCNPSLYQQLYQEG